MYTGSQRIQLKLKKGDNFRNFRKITIYFPETSKVFSLFKFLILFSVAELLEGKGEAI